MYPIICYAKDSKAVAVMGGKKASKVAEYYDIQSNRWNFLPELNQGREDASTVYHGGHLFVFGGKRCCTFLNSIERINGSCLRGQRANWLLIELEASAMLPRTTCAMASLNTNDFMILGGAEKGNDYMTNVAQVTNEPGSYTIEIAHWVENKVAGKHGFYIEPSQVATVADGHIVMLGVILGEDNHEYLTVLDYKNSRKSVQVLEKWLW